MSFVDVKEELWTEVAGICCDEGLKLYDIERIGRNELRISVDKLCDDVEEAGVQGVTSGECSGLCRRLMVYFTVEGERLGVGQEPYMEVCSPGINRNLRLPEHFKRAKGKRVKIVFKVPMREQESGKEFSHVIGILTDYRDEGFLTVEDEHSQRVFTLPFTEVKKASVDFKFK